MEEKNNTSWKEFVLLGLQHQKSPIIFLVAIGSMFFVALIGNYLLLFVINADSSLRLRCTFSQTISFIGPLPSSLNCSSHGGQFCNPEEYHFTLWMCCSDIYNIGFRGAECLILATMSYDRYVAICKPLQYPILMRRSVCYMMSVGAWFWSTLQAVTCSLYVLPLPYCKSNVINHYMCDYPALIQLSCSDNLDFERTTYFGNVTVLLIPISVILTSYVAILLQVLRVRSSEGSHKALGTCLSHLCVVGFFYGAAILTYMTSISSYSAERSMINTVFTTIIPATVNPFIYSLRNQDVLAALKKLFGKYKQCK